ncbi:hematopoietic prostaglandin D synthase-like [Amphiura filiformis]|uniref:hematopoietic prostaglandin D synthase-like n=1 Tax=Amphiura filiformis TaxID=82378 RepID=UPI003B2214A0
MPNYKLIYFNAKGRAEFARLLFAQAGVAYEDHRIEGANWPALKPTMPTEALPVLEVDGKRIVQSQAIARYVARECNLAGDNNLEMAQGEQVMETMMDMATDIGPVFQEKDEAKRKAALQKSIFEEKIKTKLKYIENFLVANGGEFFAGKRIMIADIAIILNFEHLCSFLSLDDPYKDFPKLAAHKDKVFKEPKIAAWIAKRPETKM